MFLHLGASKNRGKSRRTKASRPKAPALETEASVSTSQPVGTSPSLQIQLRRDSTRPTFGMFTIYRFLNYDTVSHIYIHYISYLKLWHVKLYMNESPYNFAFSDTFAAFADFVNDRPEMVPGENCQARAYNHQFKVLEKSEYHIYLIFQYNSASSYMP